MLVLRRFRPLYSALLCLLTAIPALAGQIVFDLKAPSAALGHDIAYTLYRPAKAPPEGQRWPVLFLLHGLGDDERAWATLGQAGKTLDRLIGSGVIKPLLVVMPMAGRSWYVDSEASVGGGVANALVRDLVAHIDSAYPTAACRSGRGIGGLSMGGYGALLYAMDHPRQYAAAFSLSGSLFPPMPAEATERAKRVTRMFGPAYGEPFDWQRFNRWNLFLRISRYVGDPNRSALYLAIGDQDFPGLMAGNAAFRRALADAGIDVPYRMDPGGHVWSLWAEQLGPALRWLDGRLSSTCP